MAGKNHHYIPRFVQNGFVSRGTGGKRKTWVFRADRDPFEPNLMGSNAENYFYGDAEDTALDDLITAQESDRFVELWQTLCSQPAEAVTSAGVPELIAHFEARTKHMRELLAVPIGESLKAVGMLVQDTEPLAARLHQWLIDAPELFAPKGAVSPRAWVLGRTRRQRDEAIRTVIPAFQAKVAYLTGAIDVSALLKNAHNSALKKTLPTLALASHYRGLPYRVVEFNIDPGCPLILGDSIQVFSIEGQPGYKPLLDKGNTINQVVIPLTASRALVGGSASSVSVSELREAAAKCSRVQFISHQNTPENKELAACIGEWANMITQAELSQLQDDMLKQLFRAE